MYDVPVADAFALLEVRDARDRKDNDQRARQQGGGLRGFHERMRRGGH